MAARDQLFMELALSLAREASREGDVPVGALVVVRGEILGWGRNQREASSDPLGHAELLALRMASQKLGDWRLPRSTLYVTLEPCLMCAGALLQARVERVVFGCRDARAGAVRSLYAVLDDPRLNHQVKVREGLLAEASRTELVSFFDKVREQQ